MLLVEGCGADWWRQAGCWSLIYRSAWISLFLVGAVKEILNGFEFFWRRRQIGEMVKLDVVWITAGSLVTTIRVLGFLDVKTVLLRITSPRHEAESVSASTGLSYWVVEKWSQLAARVPPDVGRSEWGCKMIELTSDFISTVFPRQIDLVHRIQHEYLYVHPWYQKSLFLALKYIKPERGEQFDEISYFTT